MKAFAIVTFAVLGLAFPQTLPRLQQAQAVDIRVKTLDWHPRGDALIYSRQEDSDGVGIGIYRPGDPEGKVVLHLTNDDKWNTQWFEGSTSALVTVYKKIKTAQGDGTEADIYLLDGKQKASYLAFSRTVLNPDAINIDSDLSPELNHAICTVHEGKKTYHVVLPINGGRVVASPDIDQAVTEGFSGPTWSVDGTAIFGKGDGSWLNMPIRINGGQATISSSDNSNTLVLQLSGAIKLATDGNSNIRSFVIRFAPPAPPAGTPVLEVVPSNGVLRQVRSPGPWVDKPQPGANLDTEQNQSWIDFKQMRGAAHSLWLEIPKPNRSGSDGQAALLPPLTQDSARGVLVAAHADSAELAPGGKAIAYITDGALFVREIDK